MAAERTVIVAVNDLEAEAIARLAEGGGCDVRRLGLDWGQRLDPAALDLAGLGRTVILVELPDPAFEDRLRATGRIVHVVDHHLAIDRDGRILDRRNPRSSLEQVAALLGNPALDDDQRRISANDRDFIPGLARLLQAGDPDKDVSAEVEALRLRELDLRLKDKGRTGQEALDKALAWVRGAQANGDLAVLDSRRAVTDGPCLILLRAPAEHAAALADALYLWRHELGHPLSQPLEFLAAFTRTEGERTVAGGLMFSGRGERFEVIRQLLEEPDCPGARLTRWAGGGGLGSFFGATDDLGGEAEAVDRLADRLLDELLTGNRPLVSWRTHVLHTMALAQPVTGPAKGSPWRPEQPNDQHRRYFLDHVRDLLIPKHDGDCYRSHDGGGAGGDADLHLRSYEWVNPGFSLRVTIPGKNAAKLDATVPIRALRVHLLLGDLAVVEWECRGGMCGHGEPGKVAFAEKQPGYWRQLLDLSGEFCPARPEDGVLATVAQVLDFNWAARFASSPYENPDDGASVALLDRGGRAIGTLELGKQVSPGEIDGALLAMLDEMAKNGLPLPKPKLVFDERGRVVSGVVGVGNRPRTAAGRRQADIILARLATVDPYGTAHAYDPDFAQRELEAATYDRFADFGSRYAITDQSFILVAYGAFAAKHVLPDHMPQLYRRMMLIATVYAATLNRFALRIAELSRSEGGPSDKDIRDLRRRFVRFANGLWFENVSSQLQGRELFARIRDASPITAEYEEVKAEIERTDELLDSIKSQRWQIIGGGGLIAAVTTGFLGMNLKDDQSQKLWETGESLVVLAAITIVLFAAWWGIEFVSRNRSLWRRQFQDWRGRTKASP